MTDKKVIDQYLDAGKRLTPLNGAIPKLPEWTSRVVLPAQIYAHTGNVAWVFDACDLVIDVDPRHGGKESFERILEDFKGSGLKRKLVPTVSTPRGGFHVYLKIANPRQDRKLRTKVREYPGIEFLSKGRSCTIPTSIMPHGHKTHSWHIDGAGKFKQNNAPACVLALLEYTPSSSDSIGQLSECSDAKLMAALADLDPDMSYDDWLNVGMALHSWCAERGLEIWKIWSKGSRSYQDGCVEQRWCGFDSGGAIKVGTILYMAAESRKHGLGGASETFKAEAMKCVAEVPAPNLEDVIDEAIRFTDSWLARIEAAQTLKDLMILSTSIAMDMSNVFDDGVRSRIEQAYKKQHEKLTGSVLAIAAVRNMFKPLAKPKRNKKVPEWCEKWVYVTTHNGYFDTTEPELYVNKSEAFNLENDQLVPEQETGVRPSATKYVSSNGFVEKVNIITYLPYTNETLPMLNGSRVLNSFNPASVPKEAMAHTPNGWKAIEAIRQHIEFICTTEEHYDILMQWIAHQVQNPGVLLRWGPLIQSEEGAGKSYLVKLLQVCMGWSNVGKVSPSQVKSDFNAWATGKAVNILEELKVSGFNRHEVMNALKQVLSDDTIPINPKGVNSYTSINTTNYIAFSNYKDSLPLSSGDRRWFAIEAPLMTLEDLKNSPHVDVAAYFKYLFDLTAEHGAEVRKWLLDYEITAKFKGYGIAPATAFKASMIETESGATEGLDEAKELIEQGGFMFNQEAISSPHLFDALIMLYPSMELKPYQKHIILKKLGYTKVAKSVFEYEGERINAWTKKASTREGFKELLGLNAYRDGKKEVDAFETDQVSLVSINDIVTH